MSEPMVSPQCCNCCNPGKGMRLGYVTFGKSGCGSRRNTGNPTSSSDSALPEKCQVTSKTLLINQERKVIPWSDLRPSSINEKRLCFLSPRVLGVWSILNNVKLDSKIFLLFTALIKWPTINWITEHNYKGLRSECLVIFKKFPRNRHFTFIRSSQRDNSLN